MEEEEAKSDFDVFKQKVFSFTYELVTNELSNNFYIILLVIESLQFLGYYNNGFLTFKTIGFSEFAIVVDYINPLVLMRNYNINIFLVPIFFCLSCLHFVFLFVGYRAFQERTEKINKEVADKNFHKNKVEFYANLLMVLYTTILTIPIFQTSVTAFYCSADNPFTSQQNCYVGSHIIIVIMGILNCMWLLVVNAYYTMYYYSRNPFSSSFMTCSSNWHNLGKFLIKITPMIFMMYDPSFNFSALFLIIMNLAYAGYLAFFSRLLFGFYRYNFHLEKMITGIEIFVCLLNCHFILLFNLQDPNGAPNILFLAWTVMSIILCIIVVDIVQKMKKSRLKQINSVDKKSLPQTLQFLIYLIYETESNFDSGKGTFYLSNIARTHKQKCDDPKCYCSAFFKAQKQTGYYKEKKVFYILLLAVIDRVLKNNKKAYGFIILKAYILFYKLQSSIKAATTISSVMSDKLDFSDDMLVKGLLFELNQQYSDTRDMEIYRKFNEYLLQQEEESLILTDLYLNYWEELIDQQSSIPKLQLILRKIKASKEKLDRIVNGALGIFNNHVRVLFLHKYLLREVANDYLQAIRCQQRYKIGLKQSKLSNVDTVNKIQFRQNENLLVINLTRDYTSHSEGLGKYKMVTISSNVKEFLGYTNTELKNQSVNRLIPRIYHSCHDQFIDAVLDRKNSEIQSRQIRIFPVNSDGYIVQCNLISKYMPSLTHGINIVSFLEQCDKDKDEFFIIYNSNNGIVDSLSSGAAMLLKEGHQRKNTNSIFTIPDNINDLLPNWDYKEQVYRTNTKNVKSNRTMNKLLQCAVEIREVEVTRSDGNSQKFIKILRCRGDFFDRMVSIQHQMYESSPTIQKYLENRRQASVVSEINQYGTTQIEQIIHFETKQLVDTIGQKTKVSEIKKQIKNQKIQIDNKPPQGIRKCFTILQVIFLLTSISICLVLIISSFNKILQFQEDTQLLIQLNTIESQLVDATFVTSLAITELAYTNSNLTLPYNSHNSAINVTQKYIQLEGLIVSIQDLATATNSLLVNKINRNQILLSDIQIDIKYQMTGGSKQFYTKKMTFIQSSYQFVTYEQQLLYRLRTLNEKVDTIIPSSIFFYIYVNNIDIVPIKIQNLMQKFVSIINQTMQNTRIFFIIISIVICCLVFLSVLSVIIFYRYILNSYIVKVFTLYEKITIDKIQRYSKKCYKYKRSLKGKDQNWDDQVEEPKLSKGKIPSKNKLTMSLQMQEQQSQLMGTNNEPEQVQTESHYICFEAKPSTKRLSIFVIIWFVICCCIIIFVARSFCDKTQEMNESFKILNNYNLAYSSFVRIRLNSELSLNMIKYWNQTQLQIINTQLEKNLENIVLLMNDTSLNFTTSKPFFFSKIHELKLIQSYVLANDITQLNQLSTHIINTLQFIGTMMVLFHQQSLSYLTQTRGISKSMSNNLNTYAIIIILFVLIFWLLGIKYSYKQILQEHSITYEMYNIIGYNLRKEVQNNDQLP